MGDAAKGRQGEDEERSASGRAVRPGPPETDYARGYVATHTCSIALL
jgi:hypothetical protein